MNLLVVGCGKVGSRLATALSSEGHDVSVVDADEKSFLQLGADFKGMTFVGVEVDQDVLKRAGITVCDAVAAISPDDNKNIMVSQIAEHIFHVPKVITRIYDPDREDVFCHLNLRTVCPTRLTVDAVKSALLETQNDHKTVHFGMSTLSFNIEPLPSRCIGQTLSKAAASLAAEQRMLIGALHEADDLTTTAENPQLILLESDRLVVSERID